MSRGTIVRRQASGGRRPGAPPRTGSCPSGPHSGCPRNDGGAEIRPGDYPSACRSIPVMTGTECLRLALRLLTRQTIAFLQFSGELLATPPYRDGAT